MTWFVKSWVQSQPEALAVTEISVGAPKGAGENVLRWSSEVGKAVDYYFCDGPGGEAAIHNYRTLTGAEGPKRTAEEYVMMALLDGG